MDLLRRLFVFGFGLLFAAALYFKFAMGSSQAISHYGFDLVAYIGFASIPAIVFAINIGNRNAWTAVASVVIAAAMFFWFFLLAFVSGLPGNEWIGAELVDAVLVLPLFTAITLLVRLPVSLRILLYSVLISFVALALGLQVVMRQILEIQILSTLRQGGCVFAGHDAMKAVKSANQVSIGWFISPRSDRVYFIESDKYFKWSYSSFGVSVRRGIPESFPLPSDLTCKAIEFRRGTR